MSEQELTPSGRTPLGPDDYITEEELRVLNVNLMQSEEPAEPILLEEPKPPAEPQKITICRMVEYRSRTGNYTVPAVVNCTSDSIYQPGVEHGFVPPLSALDNVHLTVFTPGKPGMRTSAADGTVTAGAENFVAPSPFPISENVSGCYQEWDIPYDPDGGPGTWRWPARV